MKKVTLIFDLSTVEGRKRAINSFCKAMHEAMRQDMDESQEEAILISYKDSEDILLLHAGPASEIAELQAKTLCKHPQLIEPTLKMLTFMLIAQQKEDDEE